MSDFMGQIDNEVKEDRELARFVRQEDLILGVTELILEKMKEKGLNKSQLADMLGTNKSHVTHLLRGSRNMTLRTVSDIFFNLDCEIEIRPVADEERDAGTVVMQMSFPFEMSQLTPWTPQKQPQVREYAQPQSIAA